MEKIEYRIKVENLTCKIGHNTVFENVNFAIKPDEALVINWRDGLGKTTFLEICAGLSLKYYGNIFWNDINIKKMPKEIIMKERSKAGFIFQNSALISNHNVFDNIALPLRYHSNLSHKEIDEIVAKQIQEFELENIKHLLPEMLTTSQSKIVSTARALVVKPEILYLDELSRGLDPESFDFLSNKIIENFKNENVTILMLSTSNSLIKKLKFPVSIIKNAKFFHYNQC